MAANRPRLLCYSDTEWVLGRITHGLAAALLDTFYVDVMDWARHDLHALAQVASEYDVIYTVFAVGGRHAAGMRDLGIPLRKVVAVAHGAVEVEGCADAITLAELGAIAAISPDSVAATQERTYGQVRRLHVGIDMESLLSANIDRSLVRVLGFGALLTGRDLGETDNKRGYLAEDVATAVKLPLVAPKATGPIWNYRAMADFYRRIDVLLSTSVREGGPYSPLEAAACGIPSIVTDCGVMSEFFAQGGGTVLPVDASEFLYGAQRKLEEYCASPWRFKEDQKLALAAAERWSWDNVIHEWRSLFLEVAGQTKAPAPTLRGPWDREIWADTLERDSYRVASMVLSEPMTIIDVGSHTGAFVIRAKQKWPKARVVAVEPDPENLVLLRGNVSHLTDVRVVPVACTEVEEGKQYLFYPVLDKVGGNSGMGTLTPTTSSPITVAVQELPDIIREEGEKCDLLKMDCEGAEAAITRTLMREGMLPKIQYIVGEWHGLANREELERLLAPSHLVTWVYGTPTLGLFFAVRNQ